MTEEAVETPKKRKKRWWIPLIIVSASLTTLIGGGILGGFVAAHVVISSLFDKRQSSLEDLTTKKEHIAHKSQADYPLLANPSTMSVTSNGNVLYGHYFAPIVEAKGLVVSIHGLGGMSEGVNSGMNAYFVEQGWGVLALDLTSSGASEGESIDSMAQSAYDVAAFLNALPTFADFYIPTNRVCLLGHSMGAYGALASLDLLSENIFVDRVCSLAGFDDPSEEMMAIARKKVGFLADMTSFTFRWALDTREVRYVPIASLALMAHPSVTALLVQGEQDQTVPDSVSLYRQAQIRNVPNAEYLSLENRDHYRLWFSDESERYYKSECEPAYENLGEDASAFAAWVEENNAKEQSSQWNLPLLARIETFFEAD